MKKLYLIGGAMGIGKTTVCQKLKKRLPNSVFLDGDWCWDASPFQVTEETKEMVQDNICHLLNNFLKCSAYDHVIFCWVMHQQKILDDILGKLDTANCEVLCISLVCEPEILKKRIEKGILHGIRAAESADKSLSYLPLYQLLQTEKIDTSALSPDETAQIIAGWKRKKNVPPAGSL